MAGGSSTTHKLLRLLAAGGKRINYLQPLRSVAFTCQTHRDKYRIICSLAMLAADEGNAACCVFHGPAHTADLKTRLMSHPLVLRE